jgi:DNA-binding NtrC family response regulator
VFMPVGATEPKKVDVRIIAATNRDLGAMVKSGSFREDLYYRLNIVTIELPPLRQRREDIPALVMHFLNKYQQDNGCQVSEISPEALRMLVDYAWPGNVRELENVIQRAVVLSNGKTIGEQQLAPEIRGESPRLDFQVPRTSEELKQRKKELREKAVEEVEQRFVIEALERNGWNVTHAAADVGMQRPNFQALMRQHRITTPNQGHSSD